MLTLIQAKFENGTGIGRFLITGTPGVGKTVSIIVWIYLAIKGELKMSFEHIIADLKSWCILLTKNGAGQWEEKLYLRDYFRTHCFKDTAKVLYLYDAMHNKYPLLLPYCSVVFSAPNLIHFKDFISINTMLRMIYFTPMWRWDEIEALYQVSTALQQRASKADIQKLFELWGGLTKQIFGPYDIGYAALISAIRSCNAVACIQLLEKGDYLQCGDYDSEVRRMLMQYDVVDDATFEHVLVNFGSPFIRDCLVNTSSKKPL